MFKNVYACNNMEITKTNMITCQPSSHPCDVALVAHDCEQRVQGRACGLLQCLRVSACRPTLLLLVLGSCCLLAVGSTLCPHRHAAPEVVPESEQAVCEGHAHMLGTCEACKSCCCCCCCCKGRARAECAVSAGSRENALHQAAGAQDCTNDKALPLSMQPSAPGAEH